VPLTGNGVLALIALAAVAAVVGAILLRRWTRLLAALVALCLGLTFAAALVNDHFSFYTSWRDLFGVTSSDLTHARTQTLSPRQPASLMSPIRSAATLHPRPGHGALMETLFPSHYSGAPAHKGFVYLPPQYFDPAWASVRFPVLELLHGAPGSPANWVVQIRTAEMMDQMIARHQVGPMVLVSADYNGPSRLHSTECVNAVHGLQMDTYVTSDVRYDVTSSLRVATSRAQWGVAGFSTGGFCSINLALRHPRLFGATAVMDGYFHAIEDHFASGLYHGHWSVRLANTPMWTWRHMAEPQRLPLHILLLAGTHDPDALVESVRFHDEVELTPRSVRRWSMAFQLQTAGGHTFDAWRKMSRTVLAWSWSQLAPHALKQRWPTVPVGVSDIPSSTLDRLVAALVHRSVHTPAWATPTASSTPRASPSPTRAPTRAPTATATRGTRPSATHSPTPARTPTASASPVPTRSPSATPGG
jgi:enterochelin esterase-like enzyme